MLLTRCPMELSMYSSATSWSCSISLRCEYDQDGNPLPASSTIPFGLPLTDKGSVEIWLRRAQAAILNPHIPVEDFFAKSVDDIKSLAKTETKMLPFSQNIVQVDLKDPDTTDLSFVDLPGNYSLAPDEVADMLTVTCCL